MREQPGGGEASTYRPTRLARIGTSLRGMADQPSCTFLVPTAKCHSGGSSSVPKPSALKEPLDLLSVSVASLRCDVPEVPATINSANLAHSVKLLQRVQGRRDMRYKTGKGRVPRWYSVLQGNLVRAVSQGTRLSSPFALYAVGSELSCPGQASSHRPVDLSSWRTSSRVSQRIVRSRPT